MGDIITLPRGFAPAMRVITGRTATEEQRRAALDLVGETYPEDLIFAVPGTPERFRRADGSLDLPVAPEQRNLGNIVAIAIASGLLGFIVGLIMATAQIVGRV